MPTRKNKTSIGISNNIKRELEKYIESPPQYSWDDYMEDAILLLRAKAEGRITIK